MSSLAHESMTNSHISGFFSQLSQTLHGWRQTLHVWRERARQRRELSRWTDRELHDVGLSWSDVVREAEKPFWRP
jgi:uncharacterized protein YjiS (DUF1127 family)